MRTLLAEQGLPMIRARRGGVLPHMLTGAPDAVRAAYQRGARAAFVVDRALSHVPLVNGVAEALEIVAERV